MASANSLLGLVNQLQSMEHHFTSILLETILKLTSLTDAKVFVLVESQDCRRIAGSEHLCRSFADGLLQPIASDRQVHLQPDIFALNEEPLAPSNGSPSDLDLRVMSVHSSNGDVNASSPSATRKRGPPSGFPRRSRLSKERKLTPSFKRDPEIQAFNSADFQVPEASFSVDQDAAQTDLLAENDFSTSAFNDSHDGGEDLPVEDDSFAEIVFSKPATLDDAASVGAPPINDGALVLAPNAAGEAGAVVAPPANHDFSFIEEFMRTNHKVGPVLSIYDDSVTEKNSVSNKVTLSLVYDFAKCLFSNCAYSSFKDWGFREFFESAFEKFWHNFPNFSVWEGNNMRFQERVDKRTNMCRMATPKSFLRQKIRINVINLMLTKHKPSNGGRITKKSLPYF